MTGFKTQSNSPTLSAKTFAETPKRRFRIVWSFDESGETDTEPFDGFNSGAEADADALASAGFGTDETRMLRRLQRRLLRPLIMSQILMRPFSLNIKWKQGGLTQRRQGASTG